MTCNHVLPSPQECKYSQAVFTHRKTDQKFFVGSDPEKCFITRLSPTKKTSEERLDFTIVALYANDLATKQHLHKINKHALHIFNDIIPLTGIGIAISLFRCYRQRYSPSVE